MAPKNQSPQIDQSAFGEKLSKESRDDLASKRMAMILAGWGGTALAGGVYGVIVAREEYLTFGEEFGSALGTQFFGFIVGCFWAGGVAIGVSLIVALILAGIRKDDTPVWITTFIGGWTGFLCIGGQKILPVVLGQIGAFAVAILVNQRRKRRIETSAVHDSSQQFTLRQLFAGTTIACLFAGGMQMLDVSRDAQIAVLICAAWQILTVLLLIGASWVIKQSRST